MKTFFGLNELLGIKDTSAAVKEAWQDEEPEYDIGYRAGRYWGFVWGLNVMVVLLAFLFWVISKALTFL